MINAAETQPPFELLQKKINISATYPPGNMKPELLREGDLFCSGYKIRSIYPTQGNQADIYIADRNENQYIVKIYHAGWELSEELQNTLKKIHHPNVVSIKESGRYLGYYYEITEYYQDGTLADFGVLSASEIEKIIIPSINEGLHELHCHNIIHCDIKPANLFYYCNRKKIAIGDCGISKFTNPNGLITDILQRTPEFAPPLEEGVSPAFDYCSLGLVVCAAVLGHSLFHGMSVEMIEKAWKTGIEFPPQINGRIASLIKGLLNANKSSRWGYQEVKRWCKGEFVSVNSKVYCNLQEDPQFIPMTFGIIDGEKMVVSSLHQLAKAIRSHWSQAKNVVRKVEVADFVYQFDQDKDLWDNICKLRNEQDPDVAVYKLLNYIEDDWHEIFFCGYEYKSISDLINKLASGNDQTALKYLKSGLLVFYLRQNEAPENEIKKLEQLIYRKQPDNMEAILTICYALQEESHIRVFDVDVKNLDELITVIIHHSISEIDELLNDEQFIAWMNRLGYEEEMTNMRRL